jgi:hypothetical protein
MNGTTLEIQKNVFGKPIKSVKLKVIFDRNSQDVYSDPGNFETRKTNTTAMFCDRNNNAYLIGQDLQKMDNFRL